MSDQAVLFGPAVLAEAARALELLRLAGIRVVTAESCTGGLVAGALTHFAGSSDVTEGGFVTYSNSMKQAVLGVQAGTLAAYGAVSAQTVEQMAEGALNACCTAGIAISISGIAGPGGGSEDKPVGLVWFATALRGGATRTSRQIFSGDRASVREQAVLHALTLICARL
ncbi:nicotinamide-nucleotide amidohydrolase family protein [Acetobacter lambici]|uniref:Nicotinamide-nucleotide amidohydrolase family protein n=1 Tax=Acetobacter lambici TaxID=1332824 RepID=A0ABT1EVN8_9PROT|nr:nicotinamide-nucleotide amidohydrolase family protein [Acetobacter lambici]MCP1241315.1 nicotinamide-nucleotide amidohydrolase family protein [Acetobacter lambici]MCP1257015.1 nicotinamide-nucleotide amidohydrolase family protein [Acetobacter lambici]NHO55508.1 nicotinamide-nucleotide amidohydrolase family protein [Acetobacter lambici]